MKALSVQQPWASLIALGLKSIETRSWRTAYHGPLAIHASAGLPPLDVIPRGETMLGDVQVVRDRSGLLVHHPRLSWPYRVPQGVIVATCRLADCIPVPGLMADGDCAETLWADDRDMAARARAATRSARCGGRARPYGDYSDRRWAWLLSDVAPLRRHQPAATGRLGLWDWPCDHVARDGADRCPCGWKEWDDV